MSLPTSPNQKTPVSIKSGDKGWAVFALQRGLDILNYNCVADGTFGPMTEQTVKEFQAMRQLSKDGIAGPATQGEIIKLIDVLTHTKYPRLPTGLIRGFATTESGNNLGAVNWNIPGGVDCGVMQVRCFGPPYDGEILQLAYDPSRAMSLTGKTFIDRIEFYTKLPFASKNSLEWTMRCAALAWNWPWAAEQFASRGVLPDPSRNATWAVINGQRIKFPDGAPVVTYDDWARFYALGGPHGEGRVTRYVTKWS